MLACLFLKKSNIWDLFGFLPIELGLKVTSLKRDSDLEVLLLAFNGSCEE